MIKSVGISKKKSKRDAELIAKLNEALLIMPPKLGGYSANEVIYIALEHYIKKPPN